jgi:hypothetical protein
MGKTRRKIDNLYIKDVRPPKKRPKEDDEEWDSFKKGKSSLKELVSKKGEM